MKATAATEARPLVRLDADAHASGERVTRTTCPYCGVGCGVEVTLDTAGAASVRGDPDHPANRGRLCSKGAALGDTLDLAERLLHPVVDGVESDWNTALDRVADTFRRTLAEHGPESVAFYVSGQLLTEDYYVVNKLAKGWLGTANIDTNSRLCMASSVAGHRRAFGSDTVPGGYEDLELADLVVLVGSNLAWCHPVIHQRLAAAKAARPQMRIVLIDPRRTATAELADLHLALRPGGDAALFAGLLVHLHDAGATDTAWVEAHTRGFADCLDASAPFRTERLVRDTGLDRATLARFYALFTERQRTVTLYSQGVNQSERGTDTVNAIINCHLATGRIGRPGCGPFSITGQPNAMGGREVGGMANMLAAHMDLERADHRELVQAFWGSPRIAERPGPKAVELFERVRDGRIKALWIMATNPAVSLPDADRVETAIAACPFVVVSDVVRDSDTLRHASVALPAAAWGEKDGTVTNSERRISRQRAFRAPPGEARADWRAVCAVAARLGWGDAFDYPDAAAIFREHAALSAAGNGGGRDFDIGACATLDKAGYDALAPFRWPWRAGETPGESRFFADGGFFTPDRRARFVPIATPPARVANTTLVLNTGRVRDQWHTMTRTGYSARLSAHLAEPFAELHPLDAAARGVADADIVEVRSAHGRAQVRALLTERQRVGSVFVPMHWSDAFASRARVDALVAPMIDPVSGQPASKSTPVELRRLPMRNFGFALLAERLAADIGRLDDEYWAKAPCPGGWRIEFADGGAADETAGRWLARLDRLAAAIGETRGLTPPKAVRALDPSHGTTHAALFDGSRLLAAVHIARTPVAASRSFCADLLTRRYGTAASRQAVLAGRPAANVPDQGAIVCSCFGVGARRIVEVARADATRRSVTAIGECLQAGTNCGSCRGEISALLHSVGVDEMSAQSMAPLAR